MNQGIEILLARMDSHPQEFDGGTLGPYGRWTYTIERALNIGSNFTKEERDALSIKLRDMARERFTQDVMKELLDGPEEKWTTVHDALSIKLRDGAISTTSVSKAVNSK